MVNCLAPVISMFACKFESIALAFSMFNPNRPGQENMRGQRGTLRALARICYRH